MYFRPFPILTLVALPALAALIGLGVWQSQRVGWKAGEIVKFEQAAMAEPQPAEAVVCAREPGFDRVVVAPEVAGKSLRVFGHDAAGVAGWRLFQIARLSCGGVMTETGFEALAIGGPGAVIPRKPTPRPDRFLLERWPEKPMMAAENAPERNEWHWFDPTLMANALDAAPLNTAAILTPLAGLPDYLTRTPPETHLGYAVTWFGMAVAFAVIYAVFHARAGRLRFRKQDPGPQ